MNEEVRTQLKALDEELFANAKNPDMVLQIATKLKKVIEASPAITSGS